MRHGKKINHLGRTASHRKAMLSNMATSLIQNKRIVTTVAKAKALRKYVEPIITKSKTDTTHSRRMVFKYLQDKESVSILFDEVSEKVADREGGYTRILKTGSRLGDNASMCVIELVDYNESLLKEAKPKRSKTRRSRRGKGGQAAPEVAAAVATVAAEVQEQEVEATEEQTAEVAAATDAVEESVEVAAATEATETEEESVEATATEAQDKDEPVAEASEAEETGESAEQAKEEAASDEAEETQDDTKSEAQTDEEE